MSVRSLEEFVQEVSGDSHLRIEFDFGDGFVRLRTSEAERRQAAQDIRCSEDILIELLRNARDAHATKIFVAISKSGTKRTITVIDDGDGIPAAMHGHIFESRVTSKLDTHHKDKWGMHGRGMALYSISVNAESARVVNSEVDLGSSIQVVSDTTSLPEKSDQSSFPSFMLGDDGTVNVRGPRNLLRTACEFAIEERNSCGVFVGSPAEIASSIYAYGMESLSSVERLFCKDETSLQLVKRPATAPDCASLAHMVSQLGLEMSERTARRIMDGDVPRAENILDMVRIQEAGSDKGRARRKGAGSRQRISFESSELQEIGDAAKRSFARIAASYYLEDDIEPTVRTSAEKMTISIPLVRK